MPQYRHQSILLDLSNKAYAFQYLHVNVTETPLISYDEDRYYVYGSNRAFVSVVGDVVGPIFPTMPVNTTSLLHLPEVRLRFTALRVTVETAHSTEETAHSNTRMTHRRNLITKDFLFFKMITGCQNIERFIQGPWQ